MNVVDTHAACRQQIITTGYIMMMVFITLLWFNFPSFTNTRVKEAAIGKIVNSGFCLSI